jgi:large subunit ribosomal protein L28
MLIYIMFLRIALFEGGVIMARVCEVCNKGKVFGSQVSHSVRHSKRTWAPNLRKVRAIVNGAPKRVSVCTRCLRTGKVERAL